MAFGYVLDFFNEHNNINFVSGRLKFFEAKDNYHYLDYKFYKTRIVNLTEEYNCIQESTSTSFFLYSSIKTKEFKEGIKSGEDIRFVSEILLKNPLMGLIKEAVYLCRKREDTTSRTQTQQNDLDFYFSSIYNVGQYLMKLSLELYKQIQPFVQYYIAYDILFRFENLSFKYLDSSDYKKYCELIESVLKMIDDKYILEQKNFISAYKILALSKKYNKDIRYDVYFEKGCLKYSDYTLINLKKYKNIIIWKKIEIINNTLHLEGIDNLWITKDYKYFCKIGNKTYYPEIVKYNSHDLITLFGTFDEGKVIIFNIKFEEIFTHIIYMYISFFNISTEIFSNPGYLSRLPSIPDGYYISENYIIKMINKRITLYPNTWNNANNFENLYLKQLNKLGLYNIIKLRKRIIRYKNNKYIKKEIWIINDEKDKAGDNGEYFFRYLKNKDIKGLDIYFAIQKNCKDFERLYNLGNILDLNSKKYLNIFMKSDKIISSVYDGWVFNPFGMYRKYIKDLFNFNIIYIKNGIIKDDYSKIFNRFDCNIKLFSVSTIKEYNYLISSKFKYNKNEVVLTGMPRFDNLHKYNQNKFNLNNNKIILIIPTWRKFIKRYKNSLIFKKIHSDNFKNTQFYQFYNSLINDKRLIKMMKLYKYKGFLCLHYNFAAQYLDFEKNDVFEIKESCDYQELIKQSSLLITDYSSIFFDFAYLKKPVIYTHFDYNEYRENHVPEGYFNYKNDGFGPICNNINSTISFVIKSIRNNNNLKIKYLKRINNFFTFFDDNNSERLFQQIAKISFIKENTFSIYWMILFLIITIIILKIIRQLYSLIKFLI